MAVAVAVVLAVGEVVLVVVADQVAQGEAVVGGDEVDARQGAAPAGVLPVTEQVHAARQSRGQVGHPAAAAALGHLGGVVEPETAHGAAVAVVPVKRAMACSNACVACMATNAAAPPPSARCMEMASKLRGRHADD